MKVHLLFVIVTLIVLYVEVECKGGFRGGSRGRGSSSRGSSSSGSSSRRTSWFSKSSSSPSSSSSSSSSNYGWSQPKPVNTAPEAPKNPSYGWTSTNPNFQIPPNPYGWTGPKSVSNVPTVSKPLSIPPNPYGWTGPNPPANVPKPASSPSNPSYGWSNPNKNSPSGSVATANKGTVNSNQPSANIGPNGYPVQGGIQRSPPPYSPTNKHGTSVSQARAPPPPYSPTNPHINPPSYSSHYPKQTINNHYHYSGPPPAYSQPSHFGMSSAYYPPQNNFGYSPGYFSNSYRPSYNGMGLFSSGTGSYGYPGAGSWGYPSYGSGNSNSGFGKGVLVGAAGGYMANSLVNRVTNPWHYSGSGYGYGYTNRYRDMGYYREDRSTPAPPVVSDGKDSWIECVAYDPTTKVTLVNPNCTCTVTVVTDPVSGQNTSHHDCKPFAQQAVTTVVQESSTQVNNTNLPASNNTLYGSDVGRYGAGHLGLVAAPNATAEADAKRAEFYSQLEKIVNMGKFSN